MSGGGGLCYSCGAEFGIFRKEHGCKNCGCVFCSKCLSKKIEVPRLNNSRASVCNRCYGIIKGDLKHETAEQPPSPPLAYKKRMEALKSKASSSSSSSSSHRKATSVQQQAKYQGMSRADIEIAERLEKLREKPKTEIETEEKIEARLASLKGMDPSRYREARNNTPVFQPTDRRTQQEQVDDLLEEIASTVALDASLPDPNEIIQQRLYMLQRDDNTSSSRPNNSSEETTNTTTGGTNNNIQNTNNLQDGFQNSVQGGFQNNQTSSQKTFSPPPTNPTDIIRSTATTITGTTTTTSTTSNMLNLSEFLGNNLNKASCALEKQPYEKNINFSDAAYGGMDPININALMTEVKQVKDEVARNLKRSGSDNVIRAGDRKSWKNFDYEDEEIMGREADEIVRLLTAEALREKEEEEKRKQ